MNQDYKTELADELTEIRNQISELLGQAGQLLQGTGCERRAEGYWLSSMIVELGEEHYYLSSTMCSMQDTINELLGGEDQ